MRTVHGRTARVVGLLGRRQLGYVYVCAGWTVITIRARLVRSGNEGGLVVLWFSHRLLDFGVDVAAIECRRRAVE